MKVQFKKILMIFLCCINMFKLLNTYMIFIHNRKSYILLILYLLLYCCLPVKDAENWFILTLNHIRRCSSYEINNRNRD